MFGIWGFFTLIFISLLDPDKGKEHQIYYENRILYSLTVLAVMAIISKFV